MCYFLTSIFSVLGVDFGASWAFTLEPSCAFWGTFPHFDRSPTVRRRPKGLRARFWRLQASIFEGLGLDLGGSGPRFWRLQASIFEPPGQHATEKLFFHNFPALRVFPPPFLPSPTAWQSSNIPTCQLHGHNPITQNSCTNSVRKPKCSQNVRVSFPHMPSAT